MSQRPTLAEVMESAADVMLLDQLDTARFLHVDTRGYDDDTALHVMAWREDAASAAVLIDAGADVDAVGDMGETPLHVAVGKRDRAMVDLLVRAGARSDVVSEFGRTAREKAVELGILDWLDVPVDPA